MCVERFGKETTLTADICNDWMTRRDNESPKSVSRRLPFIREFARYLIRNGEQAYFLPYAKVKGVQRVYSSYLFTIGDS